MTQVQPRHSGAHSESSVCEVDPVALQRCDQFVGRTTNWLYDHLKLVPRYRPAVLSDTLENRGEFPLLQAWRFDRWSLTRRVWRRLAGELPLPRDWWRLKRLSPCLLHSHFGYVAVADLPFQDRLDLPWVVSFYGADVYQLGHHPAWCERYGEVFDRATRVLALGPVMGARLARLGCPPEKIVVHPLGVDVELIPCRPRVLRPGEPLRILCAGTFREKKGFRYAAQAVGLARRAGVRLTLDLVGDATGKPGDSETKRALVDMIRGLGLEDIVSHSPFVTFRELIDFGLRSHVFLAPSVTASDGDAEGTPFVLQQMIATGMPAIATAHSDIPYLFGELRHLLVPERDVRAIADRLVRYADDPETLRAEGLALQNHIRNDFDARQCAARLADLYDAIGVERAAA